MIAAIGPGTTFGAYRVEGVVGRGGMGVVYRATDLSLARPVALKLIAPELAGDERFRARFLREPRLAASLDHPSVVPIYEAGERDGQLYLVMRFVEGSDLKTVLEREGTLPPERALTILTQIAGALDAAHRRGLVHRDVKPANVLLDEDGHAYLSDFGISKQLGSTTADTGGNIGTLDYLAPEQIRGEQVDGRSDCYALTCVLYECLAGTPPFRRPTQAETLWAHMQDRPPALPGRARLDPVIKRGLAKERERRYPSCSELVAAAGEASGLGSARSSKRFSQGGLLLLAGGLLLALVALLALLASRGGERSDPGRPALDLATNQVAAVSAASGQLESAAPLPGRATDMAAGRGTVWVATVDSAAVTGVSARARRITRTIPLTGRADAVAFGEGSVWVADGGRGILSRIDAGYEEVAERIRFPRAGARGGRLKASRAGLAVGGGAVWVTNGSRNLIRIDPKTGKKISYPAGRPLTGVAAGAGAVWTISARPATVLRFGPRGGEVTEIPIAARAGDAAPAPVAVAASSQGVWVLNDNTATVTEIDPRTLGVIDTIALDYERVPGDISASGDSAWVANGDGTLARISSGAGEAVEIEVGESLDRVAASRGTVWVATTALDQKLPGGAG